MVLDLHTVQEEIALMLQQIQPWTLAQLVTWLDLRIAEYKVLGYMIFDEEYIPNRKRSRLEIQNSLPQHKLPDDSNLPGYTFQGQHRTTVRSDQQHNMVRSRAVSENINTGEDNTPFSKRVNIANDPIPSTKGMSIWSHQSLPSRNCNSYNEGNVSHNSFDDQNDPSFRENSVSSSNQHVPNKSRSITPNDERGLHSSHSTTLDNVMSIDGSSNTMDNCIENVPHIVTVKSEFEFVDVVGDSIITQNTDPDSEAAAVNNTSTTSDNITAAVTNIHADDANKLEINSDLGSFFKINMKHVDLPTFDVPTERFLIRNQSEIVWNKVVELCAFHLLSKGNPAVGEYKLFCAALFNKYPAIGRKHGTKPWSKFSRCLSQKIRTIRHQVRTSKNTTRRTEIYKEVVQKGMVNEMKQKECVLQSNIDAVMHDDAGVNKDISEDNPH